MVRSRSIVVGDVHSERQRLNEILDLVDFHVDLALLAGDMGQDVALFQDPATRDRTGHDESVRYVVGRVQDRLSCPVVYVPGNHDLADPAVDVPGTNADGRIVEVAGLRIAGFGGAGPASFGFPYEWTEEQADRALASMFAGNRTEIDVFLSHTPPRDTKLDRTARGVHVGSTAVKDWIERIVPKLFVCGHIHEAWGLEWIGATPCLNAGALGVPFPQELVWIVSWQEGPARVEALRRDPDGSVDRQELPLLG